MQIYGLVDANVDAAAAIKSTKLQHRFEFAHSQTGTIGAAKEYVRIVRGATANVLQIEAAVTEVLATDVSRTVTVDLQKSTGGGAFASILSATIVLDTSSVLYVPEAGTLASGALTDGDLLRIVVTVAGGAGAQAQGLLVSVTIDEDPT